MSNDEPTTRTMSTDLDSLVPEWLTLPEVADRLEVSVGRVRQLLREGELLAVPHGERGALHVPAAFLAGNRVLKGLGGTLTVLHDAGYDAEEAVRWFFTAEDALACPPITALAQNRGKEVRRQAQALGF
ncbi:Rv2175c family DNA-binding protein [Actinopolymorpha alba]|uniref:Rv2175c family DNA-binding protein n=1 Tax=Actinopolymorpha alba TaxID=533267 RepID=UPI0003793465|nr:Rv2175c family DNA-binding protein [Actinopolymorpha alba]